MTKTTAVVTGLVTLAVPTSAFAHAGDHSHITLASLVEHVLSSPFHVAGLALAGVLIAGLVALTRTEKLSRAKSGIVQRRRPRR
ncbi:MAG: hypothetical protein AAGD23_04840 [Pseudomonadota bacterium]